MDNLENLIHELDSLSSDGTPQIEPLTFQSKGRGVESPRRHQELLQVEIPPHFSFLLCCIDG
jgi:hypothetical protein